MGTWMATIRFPDGVERYARYSTVVEALVSDLYPASHVHNYREEPAGEPLPTFRDRPRAPVDQLIPVVISHAPDDDRWHAVYCPQRCMIVGPVSPYRSWRIQEANDLVPGDGDGLRHLSQLRERGLCGAPVVDAPLTYRRYLSWGEDGDDQPPFTDIYADWAGGEMCRDCLLLALDQAE
ncbi:hypothetical protein [Actinoplanes sp. HUAS TT8]|uniref:hypothetical protein n=1 Tax=Actinoplanes sp. HUAS TT8 TaxID=3447453 RepID=UPI003F51E02D